MQQSIREVAHGSPDYWAMVALRDAVLRKPLGLRYSDEQLAAETDALHVACFRGEQVVGCLVLRPQDGDGRMTQVAVAEELRGQGIGRALVEYCEAAARRIGYRRIVLSARETALEFYEKLGYRRIGEPFDQVTIPHWAMEKSMTDASRRVMRLTPTPVHARSLGQALRAAQALPAGPRCQGESGRRGFRRQLS